MNQFPDKLRKKLNDRSEVNSIRSLGPTSSRLIDFSSNDYLGFSSAKKIFNKTSQILREYALENNGATGSRLLSGNNKLIESAEAVVGGFHKDDAIIFNSGYDANIGFFGCVPQRGDLIFYDELVHASIRDGISMSKAKGYKFKHNDLENLRGLIKKQLDYIAPSREVNNKERKGQVIYIVTESVFSMDGDMPDLHGLADFCSKHAYYLIVDEAHAVGVVGKGRGACQELNLEEQIFARIITFGKAMGCHGAAILGSKELVTYLLNFARSFIYTTALSPHSAAAIIASYQELIIEQSTPGNSMDSLSQNISLFRSSAKEYHIEGSFIESTSAIHSCVVPGNLIVKSASDHLKRAGLDVKAILSPTVPEGKERLRICLHSFNTALEIKEAVKQLATFVNKLHTNAR